MNLIEQSRLPVSDALLERLTKSLPEVRWHELDAVLLHAYARRVALLEPDLRPLLFADSLTESAAFYNAYFWALVFARRHQARHGFDAGVEQDAHKVLERAPVDVDWQVLESITQAALRS